MKRLMTAAVALMMAIGAQAQYLNDSTTPFYEGKWYIGASASGFDLSYHKSVDWHMNVQAKAGYLFMDNWMITAALGYEKQTDFNGTLKLGGGMRYYFESCGIYLGASGNYYDSDGYSDFRPEVNVGYAHFLSRNVTFEPELFYEFSTKDKDRSGFGVRIGFGLYF